MRIITVIQDGISQKVIAGAITSLVASGAAFLVSRGVHLTPEVELLLVSVATSALTAIASYLVPDKTTTS